MRYFYYIETKTVVIICKDTTLVSFYPRRDYNKNKNGWLIYYETYKHDDKIFEICENQFKKFKEKGIIPINCDWENV